MTLVCMEKLQYKNENLFHYRFTLDEAACSLEHSAGILRFIIDQSD